MRIFFCSIFKNILIILSVCALIEPAFSQKFGGIKGSVTDSATGESIPYAIIQIPGTKIGTSSNINGFFFIKNIPFGTQTVQVMAAGYRKVTKVIKIETEDPMLVNLSIAQQPVELQAVTKVEDRLKHTYETNISVQPITQEELKLVPITVERDIFKVLKVLPGISSTGDVTSQFYVRGGGGDQNLILVDNIMIYNPFHALGLFSIFNADAIKYSEILTGGAGPEFGGRLSSVINITTKEGNKNKFASKLNFGILSGQGLIEGPIPGGSFFASFRKSYFDKILKKFIGKNVPLSFYDMTGKITFDLSSEGRLIINGLLSNDDITSTSSSEPDYKWFNGGFGINLQTFVDQYFVNVSFSHSLFKGSVDPKYATGKSKSQSIVSNFFFDAKVESKIGNNDLFSAGFSLLFPTIEYSLLNNASYYVDAIADITEPNIWFKYKWMQVENLIAEFGLRTNLTYFPQKLDYSLEPRLGVKYQIMPDLAVKASFGRYHQMMITTSNEDDVVPLFETWVPISDPFLPERCDQYIFGFETDVSQTLNLTVQGYYKKFTNLLGYNLNRIEKEEPEFAVGRGISYGMETFLKFQADIFYGWLAYTWSWSKNEINDIAYYPRYDKRHILNLILGSKIFSDLNITLHWELSSGMPFSPVIGFYDRIQFTNLYLDSYVSENGTTYSILGDKNSKRLPIYHKLDFNLTKSFIIFSGTKINLNIDLINLYNQSNIFYFNRQTSERINMLPFLPSLSLGVEL